MTATTPQPTPTKTTLTRYVVQALQTDAFPDAFPDVVYVWRDLGIFAALNARKAVEQAMQDKDLTHGNYRAIPETSAKVHSAKAKVQISFED